MLVIVENLIRRFERGGAGLGGFYHCGVRGSGVIGLVRAVLADRPVPFPPEFPIELDCSFSLTLEKAE